MPAVRLNYVVTWNGVSQVYGTASRDIALTTGPPDPAISIEDKRIFYIAYHPDSGELVVSKFEDEEVWSAEIDQPKPKKAPKKKETNEQEEQGEPDSAGGADTPSGSDSVGGDAG